MLKDKRKEIADYIQHHKTFLANNAEVIDIYDGNLLHYVDAIMKTTLSKEYYTAIKERLLPINILQRYIDKVSTAYEKSPERKSKAEDKVFQEFVDFYKELLDMDASGQIADQYANLCKGFAWEPYVNEDKKPCLRELAFDKFLVMSTSISSPETEDVFIKFMGCATDKPESLLIHVYTKDEFDAFYMNMETDKDAMAENPDGVNPVGEIPFHYGKRQKSKLIPTPDSDMLSIGKALSVMLSDAAGAQMFQCFTMLYTIDIEAGTPTMAPNALWSMNSKNQDHQGTIGEINPTAQTDKVLSFVMNVFVLWLETKGVRVGSVGSMDAGNFASGISKIIDEMDVDNLKRKSHKWFKQDEENFWNNKMPKIHNYWVKNSMIDSELKAPGIVNGRPDIKVTFPDIEPQLDYATELSNIEKEINLGTMTLEQGIRQLHPKYTDVEVQKVMSNRVVI